MVTGILNETLFALVIFFFADIKQVLQSCVFKKSNIFENLKSYVKDNFKTDLRIF